MNGTAIWAISLVTVVFGSVAICLIGTPSKSAETTFQTPLGVVPLKEGVPFQPPLRNGYLKTRAEDGTTSPVAIYHVSISAERINTLVERLANEALPDRIYATLETWNLDAESPSDFSETTYLTDFRDKAGLMAVLHPYRFRLVHDGFVGFGFAWYGSHAPDLVEEVFVTSKKVIVIRTSQESLVEQLLRDEQIPPFDDPCFITEYETMVSDLYGCADVFGAQYPEYAEYASDEFLASKYVPQLIGAVGFRPN